MVAQEQTTTVRETIIALVRFIGCSNPCGGLQAEAFTQFNEQVEIHIEPEHCLTGTVSGARKRKKYRDNDDRIKKAITNYGLVGTALFTADH